MNELERNKRDLNVLYDFAVEYAEQCNLTIEDTIQCNFDRLNKALADYDELKKLMFDRLNKALFGEYQKTINYWAKKSLSVKQELNELEKKIIDIYEPLNKPLIPKKDCVIAIEKLGKLVKER